MIECKTEAEMIQLIKDWIAKNYPKSRIPNPDYSQAGTYSAQWKALGAIYYWKFKDTIVAIRYGKRIIRRYLNLFCFERLNMNWQEYQEAAMRTQADQRVILNRLIALGPKAMQFDNAVTGLSDEVGELNNVKKKWIEYGQELDVTNVKEEVGDCLWRLNQICTALGLTLEECAEGNILKLAERYPEKYSDHLAAEANRNREAERESLDEYADLREAVQKALDTGWEIIGDIEAAKTLIKPGDVSNRWAANWIPILWQGETLSVPHWLPRRLKELNPVIEIHDPGLPDPPIEGGYKGGDPLLPQYNQTGQGWSEPVEDYDGTDPIHVTTTPTPRISEKTFQETGYTDICKECHHTPVHHTNTFKVCGTCWAKPEIKAKYVAHESEAV